MVKEAAEIESIDESEELEIRERTGKKSAKWAYILGIFGIIATILMAVAVVIWNEEIRELQQFGYVGAFIISVLGGATIIIPVPALAVVFTLGGVMDHVWLVGISAALGELVGALTIYMTGHGAGRAIANSKHGRVQRAYEKLLGMMERKGPIILFIVASVINPFFYPAALAAGALRFGIWKYTVIVFAGKIIKCMTVVYAGYYGLKGIFRAIGVDV
ncbi:MAG TPA: VTT domain-containing protein [Dehalococcoidia bacterium]|nr:VTT domain-containing protein [Dehalococcoidia bacterium]